MLQAACYSQINDTSEVFNSVILEIKVSENTNRNLIHHFWDVNTGAGLSISSEFYMGELGLGVDYISFNKKSVELPDFKSLFFFLSWKNKVLLFYDLYFFIKGKAGIYNFIFERIDDSIHEGLLNESEITLGVSGGISYKAVKGLNISFSVSHIKVFTNERINLVFINAGLSKTFNMPSWLKDILK